MDKDKVREYDGINVYPSTKKRVDKLYYAMKVDKNFKSFDQFINYIFDVFEDKN